jgi:prepilin-type N-terminal cleavage/methylation domain-containing protein
VIAWQAKTTGAYRCPNAAHRAPPETAEPGMGSIPRGPRGYTLVELVITLLILGVLTALAAPRFAAPVRRLQMELVLNQLSRDIFYARMVAVRSGRPVEVRFEHPRGDSCVAGYRIVLREQPEREVKHLRTSLPPVGPCLRRNGPNPLVLGSRGRPTWNHSFWSREGAVADSMAMTQLGRLRRWP